MFDVTQMLYGGTLSEPLGNLHNQFSGGRKCTWISAAAGLRGRMGFAAVVVSVDVSNRVAM